MIQKYYVQFVLALLTLTGLGSCRDEVILDLNTVGPKLVVEGKIDTDTVPFKIRLTTTADYYSTIIPVVTDAFVTIYGSDGSKDTLHYDTAGYYISKKVNPCKVGVDYTLSVDYKGAKYTSTERCLPQNPVDSVRMIYAPRRAFLEEGYYLWEFTTEKPGKGDCYQWELYQNDTSVFDDFYYIADDNFLQESGQYIIQDFQHTFRIGDTVVFEQYAISRQYYNFLQAISQQVNRDGSPFSAPPSNIGGNISNSALGYFAVRNLIRKHLVVK